METLKELSQNFPKYATSLSRRVTVDPKLEEEVKSNSIKATPGANVVWLNGAVVDEKHMDPYAYVLGPHLCLCLIWILNIIAGRLLRLLRKERSLIHSLTSLGLTSSQAVELLTHPVIAAAQNDNGAVDGIFDASDRPEEGGVIVWWNDIEKDKR
jgi:UDP-glucose:glycoprotein glucosyltransferase